MTTVPTIALNDGNSLPSVGFGTYPLDDRAVEPAVAGAISSGYTLIDSAYNYGNEKGVGRGFAESGEVRSSIQIATKLPGRHQGFDSTIASFTESRERLGLEYVDLYLIHWPNPSVDRYVDSWRAMIALQKDGLIRSIGVSNFTEDHLTRLADETGVLPAVNQVELHPYFPQHELRAFHTAAGIATEAWSPLGQGKGILEEAVVVDVASRLGVSPAQAVLRWHVQLNSIPIPKSADAARQAQNLDLFSFELSPDDLAAISSLSRGRLGGDPRVHEEQ
ncbi:aldo/keto reductase [Subtercola endophyticus]|uniref:aldo/keto reductase n=1 Tax=Subtercola endophyticus TaxID=2895559 RepID=UPI001E38EAD4|nr:aldo/keto reductase [Subtercola endophyticus]UFS58823.1 aldo/keto reductase [Subtercola endophyticus]